MLQHSNSPQSPMVHRIPVLTFCLEQWHLKSSQPYLRPISESRLGKASFALIEKECGRNITVGERGKTEKSHALSSFPSNTKLSPKVKIWHCYEHQEIGAYKVNLSYSGNFSSFLLRAVFEHANAPGEMVITGLSCTPGHVPSIMTDMKSYALEASQEFSSLLSCFLSDRCSKSCWLTQRGKHTFGFLRFSPLLLAKCSKK